MNRNLHSRIEVVFPLYDEALCGQLDHILKLQLNDNRKAVRLNSSLENQRISPADGHASLAAQEAIYDFVKGLS
jgi:polyphosphate kinase